MNLEIVKKRLSMEKISDKQTYLSLINYLNFTGKEYETF